MTQKKPSEQKPAKQDLEKELSQLRADFMAMGDRVKNLAGMSKEFLGENAQDMLDSL